MPCHVSLDDTPDQHGRAFRRGRTSTGRPVPGELTAEHERRCNEYAALLSHVEQAADALVRRLHETGERS